MAESLLKRIARLRVSLGFGLGLLCLWLSDPTLQSVALGALVAFAGEALRVWAAGHLEKGREVTMTGPYRLTRHPLYAGSAIIGAGVAIASGSAVVAAVVLGYLAVTLTAAIRTEESHLTDKFGAAYPAYRDGRAAGAPRRFSLARARRNREHRAVTGLAVALVLLWWKAQV